MVRMFDRIFLFLYSLIIGIAAIFLIVISAGLVNDWVVLDFVQLLMERGPVGVTAIIIGVVLFLISVRFFYISVAAGSSKPPSIDQRTDFGDISISMETIENLTLKAAYKVNGIKDIKARVQIGQAGLIIRVRAVVDGDIPIPTLTEEAQRSVKTFVEDITGLPVTAVNVFIANITQNQTFKSRVE